MRTVLFLALLAVSIGAFGQNFQIAGEVLDEKAMPMPSATAVLLDPADSTLLYFGIAGNDGKFSIRNIKKGTYLLQVSYLAYITMYRQLEIPSSLGEDLGTMIMLPKTVNIDEVFVTGERIPIRIKKDTIEYDAKAYKVKTDAVAEDLIRKLPGMEVDRAGNIKAMGEDVNNVLVDGKEFFGNDPKVATRNLPADAINKIQLFDKPTDESQFTGIDDGIRNQTLNLVLDEDKKTGIFGDVNAGIGTGDHYQSGIKAYRFTEKMQLAALGMFNNINQFGFSISDYISFSGGLEALGHGSGKIMLGGGSSFPVNFGQPVYGYGSNGAAGLNFSVSKSKNNRFFVSYLGNGSRRTMSETSTTRFFKSDGSYLVNDKTDQVKRDTAHRINFGWRRMVGEKQNLIVNGGLSYNSSSNPLSSVSGSGINDIQVNQLERESGESASRLSGNADASYLLKINEGKTIFKLSGRTSYSGNRSKSEFLNRTQFFNPYQLDVTNQFFNTRSTVMDYSATTSITQKISRKSFLDLSVNTGYSSNELSRKQGDISLNMTPIDSLSPDFGKTEKYIRPALTWRLSTVKSQFSLSLVSYFGSYNSILQGDDENVSEYFYLGPKASWEYDYRSGRRIMVDFSSGITTPGVSQLLPVVNNINSLSLFYGNRDLRPETYRSGNLSWWLFDQFSFTTLLTGLNMTYTTNKINYSRTVNENLGQVITLVNVRDDWEAGANIDFSTPVRPLGLMVNLALSEDYNRGISIINGNDNISNNFIHRISLTLDNRKKDKWDIETGSALRITNSSYSIQESLDNVYRDISWFGEARFTPGPHFSFQVSADITGYSAQSFNESQLVPLVGAEVNYYFLRNQRGVLTVAGVDLLNRNTGIERKSELNYLMERRSEIIGRFIMFSFKYRLSKTGDNNSGIDIQVKKR